MTMLLQQQERQSDQTNVLDQRSVLDQTGAAARYSAARIEAFRTVKIEFMDNPDFKLAEEDPVLAQSFLAPAPELEAKFPRRVKAPEGLPPYLADLWQTPLLTREQEAHLFRKMNFLKFQAFMLREQHPSPTALTLETFERLQSEAQTINTQIILANLRLVVSIAKKFTWNIDELPPLISDGNMLLFRAVQKFDFARGFKFSTYASWAIRKVFSRSIPQERARHSQFISGAEMDWLMENHLDHREDAAKEAEAEAAWKGTAAEVEQLLGCLKPRERRIIEARYGINGAEEMTLTALGRELKISKERVRQIEARATEKMQRQAHGLPLERRGQRPRTTMTMPPESIENLQD